MTHLDTRLARAGIIAETRAIMTRSADQARRGTSRREIIARLTAATEPAPLALPAPAPMPEPEPAPREIVDLTGVAQPTERELATATGLSLAAIAKAITSKKIRTTKVKGQPRRLDVASCARWLQREHFISPEALLDITPFEGL